MPAIRHAARPAKRRLAALLLALCTAGAARAQVYDPLESVNRVIFNVNDALDRDVVRPIAQGYVDIVPRLVRTGVSNVFGNLGDAFSAINNLLQGKKDPFGSDLSRVLVNSTIGLGGIFDIATDAGLEKYNEDFGQTLGRWGLASGPYLVLPIFGPSSVRDGLGFAVDIAADPVRRTATEGQSNNFSLTRIIDTRASLLSTERLIDGAALDRYSFIRDGYLQRRRNQVYDGNPPPSKDE